MHSSILTEFITCKHRKSQLTKVNQRDRLGEWLWLFTRHKYNAIEMWCFVTLHRYLLEEYLGKVTELWNNWACDATEKYSLVSSYFEFISTQSRCMCLWSRLSHTHKHTRSRAQMSLQDKQVLGSLCKCIWCSALWPQATERERCAECSHAPQLFISDWLWLFLIGFFYRRTTALQRGSVKPV